jgi:hypothetical protein
MRQNGVGAMERSCLFSEVSCLPHSLPIEDISFHEKFWFSGTSFAHQPFTATFAAPNALNTVTERD